MTKSIHLLLPLLLVLLLAPVGAPAVHAATAPAKVKRPPAPPPASTSSQDDDFLAAREAFRVGDRAKLASLAPRLKGYLLEPYVQYWQLRLRLDDATAEEVQAVLAATRDSAISDRLRADWLKLLGRRQEWGAFQTEYLKLVNGDNETACYALQAGLAKSAEEWTAEARRLWFTGRDMPEACNRVFDTLSAQGNLSEEDVWARIRLALESGNTGVARAVAGYLPAGHGLNNAPLPSIATNPQAWLDRGGFDLKTRGGREATMFAAHRLARTSPQLAAERWEKLGPRFSDEERGYVWAVIAYLGAMRHDPSALVWFGRAGPLTDLHAGWKVRAALRAQNWKEVLAAIGAMSPKEQQDPAWRYWKARALKQAGRPQEAQALLEPLSREFGFYGQLATEELGARVGTPPTAYRATDEEVQAMARIPALQRTLVFYGLNLKLEGIREWIWGTRDFDDRQLLAAAEFGRRNELWDRAINTAERTRELHDFSLRYLAPYREQMRDFVAREQLDEAWVLGLIRQESRFIADARSSAGARGLMQLMPATAAWAAKKAGVPNWSPARVADVDVNLNLGTWYLRHVYDTLDSHPVLASAAYNAGPGRARVWRPDIPLEGAIYAETIPFSETRDYVKKVMSNATYYANVFTQQLQSLRQRLGVVNPRNRGNEKSLVDEP